jgi:hypothetical protein
MRDQKAAAKKAWATRRSPSYKAKKTEQASKTAFHEWCKANGWKVLFFESERGAPRTGIVDAIITRIKSSDADAIKIKLVQLKSGASGLTSSEVARIKQAVHKATVEWIFAAFDGERIHVVPQ